MSATTGKHTSFTGDVTKLVSGTVIAQVISFVAMPILTRLYAPEDYGVYAVFVSLLGIITIVVCLRYDYAILLPDNDQGAVNVFLVALASVIIISLLSLMILLVGARQIVIWLNMEQIFPYLWLIPAAVISQGFFLALRAWFSRSKRFKEIAMASVAATLTTVSSQLGLGLWRTPSAAFLITGYILASLVSVLVLGTILMRYDGRLLVKYASAHEMWRQAVRYRKFPLVDTWGAFSNNLSWQLPPLLLSSFFGSTVVGYYSMAYRVVQLPVSLVGTSISQVFYQRLSELRGLGKPINAMVGSMFHQLMLLGLLPALILMVIGQDVFTLVFGPQWSEAGLYFQILSLWTIFWFVASPLSTVFPVMERQEIYFIFTIANLVTRLVAMIVGGHYQNPYVALTLFAIFGIAVYGAMLLTSLKLAGVEVISLMHKQKQNILVALGGGGIILGLSRFFSEMPVFSIVCGVIIVGLYYLYVLSSQLRAMGPSLLRSKKR